MRIIQALETPDGKYRVEVVQKGREVTYRLLRDNEIWHARAAIGSVEYFLAEEGVSMADLVEVSATPEQQSGAA